VLVDARVVCRSSSGQDIRIHVRSRLCADFEMVTLASGLGGASSKLPCVMCCWDWSNPTILAMPQCASHFSAGKVGKGLVCTILVGKCNLIDAKKSLKAHVTKWKGSESETIVTGLTMFV
jgi:hypothetical protein